MLASQMRAGLDGLVIDLLEMVDTWMRGDEEVQLTKEQMAMVRKCLQSH